MEEISEEEQQKRKFTLIIIIAVIILAIGLVFMFLRSNLDNSEEANNNEAANQESTANANSADAGNINASTNPVARTRDVKRVNDIKAIMNALDSYYGDNSQYPEFLTALVDNGYLGSIPQDPNSGTVYSYTPIGSAPFQSYDLCYTLETNEVENIAAGEHCANQNGITGFF